MTDPADGACLLYCLPHDPNTTRKFILHSTATCLGRLTTQQAEPPHAGHLHLDLPTVSVRHAKIVRTDSGYMLENWQGRYGIGLYERELLPGESHLLAHCDVFRIPALEEHVRFQFLVTQQQTQIVPLSVERSRGKVYVFGERIKLTPMEYKLIAYLHQRAGQLCLYTELMVVLWGDANPYERKGNLEVLLHDVKAKLRAASGGFTFLETARGQGVRLVV
jgi:DNA-binding winged helix-turn-helix (wHTH) protein